MGVKVVQSAFDLRLYTCNSVVLSWQFVGFERKNSISVFYNYSEKHFYQLQQWYILNDVQTVFVWVLEISSWQYR